MFLNQVGKAISLMSYTCHYYHGEAPFCVGEDVEEGEQRAEEEVRVQLIPDSFVPSTCADSDHSVFGGRFFLEIEGCPPSLKMLPCIPF